MPSPTPDFIASVQSVRAVAAFFDEVTHRLQPRDLRHGSDIVKFAGRNRIKIPGALDGFTIKYDAKPHTPSVRDIANTVVVELPPRASGTAAKTISGCFDVGKGPIKGKVCVSCTISWTRISCKITITITVGF